MQKVLDGRQQWGVEELAIEVVPQLKKGKRSRYKGQLGKVGVVGGSPVYSGAPYFAATAALKAGAELAHLYTHPQALHVIKTYSPDLMVHPYYHQQQQQQEQEQQEQQEQQMINDYQQLVDGLLMADVVVVGPGLGREMETLGMVSEVLKRLVGMVKMLEGEAKLHTLVLDADYLWLLAINNEDPDFAYSDYDLSYLQSNQYLQVILTPNNIEFQRLVKAHNKQHKGNVDYEGLERIVGQGEGEVLRVPGGHCLEALGELAHHLGVTIFLKGQLDIFYHQHSYYIHSTTGSAKRPGGIGDILSGVLAIMTHWSTHAKNTIEQNTQQQILELQLNHIPPLPAAAMLASWIVKKSSSIAEQQVGIFSLSAQDVINNMNKTMQILEKMTQK